MQNVVEVPCASMRVRFLCVRACGSVHARVHACACARTQSLRLSLFSSVRACVSTRARVDWRASAQQRAATLDSLAACVLLSRWVGGSTGGTRQQGNGCHRPNSISSTATRPWRRADTGALPMPEIGGRPHAIRVQQPHAAC